MAENEWTDELKQEVVEAYEKRDPTPENTMEIVKEVADEFGKTPNGVRMVLTRAGVYVKKTVASGGGTKAAGSSNGGAKRVNKADAIEALKAKIAGLNQDVDDDICDRLTGKAAVYFTGILGNLVK